MKIIKISSINPELDIINIAIETLTAGEIIVYPTDTCYGLGVNALDPSAIKRLYDVKHRDPNKPTHVVVRDWKMIESLCVTNELARSLYDKYLPGPLTIVMKKKSIVPDELTGGLDTLGVRIPDNQITKLISENLSFPYTTTSANRSGENPPYSVEELNNVLDVSRIDLILDAGVLPLNLPSTMVDVSEGFAETIRAGVLSINNISE